MDVPAVPKLTFVPPVATPPPGWGSPHAYATGEEEMWDIQRRKFFSVHTKEYSSGGDHYGSPDELFTKGHIPVVLCYILFPLTIKEIGKVHVS